MIFVQKKYLLCFVKLSSFYPSFTEIKSQIYAKKTRFISIEFLECFRKNMILMSMTQISPLFLKFKLLLVFFSLLVTHSALIFELKNTSKSCIYIHICALVPPSSNGVFLSVFAKILKLPFALLLSFLVILDPV